VAARAGFDARPGRAPQARHHHPEGDIVTTIQETAQDRAGRLGKAIWMDILPHAEALPTLSHRSRDSVPEAARLVRVTEAAQLREGDLILVMDNNQHETGNNRLMDRATVREAVRQRDDVRRIVSVSAKMIKVAVSINIPRGGWGSCNPDRIGAEVFEGSVPERLNIEAGRWTVARLGHLDEITERFQAHPDFVAWREAYHDAVAERDASNERYRARAEVTKKKRAPILAAIEGFNALVGDKLIDLNTFGGGVDEVGEIAFPVPWFAEGDRLAVYAAGLYETGKISRENHAAALAHLLTLGLVTPDDIPGM
jgi:hypothetical protein